LITGLAGAPEGTAPAKSADSKAKRSRLFGASALEGTTMRIIDLLVSRAVDHDGQGLAEYALILALIAIIAIVALIFLGHQVSSILTTVSQSV